MREDDETRFRRLTPRGRTTHYYQQVPAAPAHKGGRGQAPLSAPIPLASGTTDPLAYWSLPPRFSILHSTNRVQSLALNQESQCPGVRYNKNRYIFFFDGNPGMAAQTVRCRRVVADKSQVTRPVEKEEFPTQRQGTARAVFFDVRDSEGRPFPKWRNNRLVSARQVTRTICDAQVSTSLKTPRTTTALLHTTAPLTSIQSRALLSTRNIKRDRESSIDLMYFCIAPLRRCYNRRIGERAG